MSALEMDDIPADFPVVPIAAPANPGRAYAVATCGECGLSWDDTIPTAYTPAPSGRCPFEAFHEMDEPDYVICPECRANIGPIDGGDPSRHDDTCSRYMVHEMDEPESREGADWDLVLIDAEIIRDIWSADDMSSVYRNRKISEYVRGVIEQAQA